MCSCSGANKNDSYFSLRCGGVSKNKILVSSYVKELYTTWYRMTCFYRELICAFPFWFWNIIDFKNQGSLNFLHPHILRKNFLAVCDLAL